MKHWTHHGMRLYAALDRAWRFVYRYPATLLLLPLAVFFPLLDSRGLYEYGDANFPLNPFWVDYILPWSGAASAGADNTFIGVPRLVYHVVIDVLIWSTHNIQVSQWLWYSSMSMLGLYGGFLLARRLGAGRFAVPLAIFFSLNLWSYDRIAQGPIFLSYQAMPLVVYLLLRYFEKTDFARAVTFGVSVLLVIPSLQVCYLTVVICVLLAIREVIVRGWRVLPALGGLALAVVAANAFYVFSMFADALWNAGGNIALVNARFNIGVFLHYSDRISVQNTLRLASFYYSTFDRQYAIVQFGLTLLPLLLGSLLLLARRPTVRSPFYFGLLLSAIGIWLVDGIMMAQYVYRDFRNFVPGLRSFVEPDYFEPMYIFGAFVMLAAAVRLGARAYRGLFQAAVWIVALTGVLVFLPINGGWSGMPQTGQPRQYAEFSRAKVPGNTLWMPPDRGVTYRWSAYNINGFTSLNSPSDALGPTMAESVAPGADRLLSRLGTGFENGQVLTVRALGPLLNVGTIAIAADSLSPTQAWPNPEVEGALESFKRLQRAGYVRPRSDEKDVGVHLVTGTTVAPLPELGVYDAPVSTGNFDNFMWWLMLEQGSEQRYVPVAADLPAGRSEVGGLALSVVPPPPLVRETFGVNAFDSLGDCSAGSKNFGIPRNAKQMLITTDYFPRCLVLNLRGVQRMKAVQITAISAPEGVVQPEFAFNRKGHDGLWADPSQAATEIPDWAQGAVFIAKIPPNSGATVGGIRLAYVPRNLVRSMPAPRTCTASDVNWTEQNPMMYTLSATVAGRCTLVFRQAFAPIWSLESLQGGAKIYGHLQVDGFANGWVIEGNGPVTLRVVNRAFYAYVAGMVLTVASLALALFFGVRTQVRSAARKRAQRAAQPA